MPLGGLQHYTVESQDLERTKNFYVEVLGLEIGDRPPRSISRVIGSIPAAPPPYT
jgi:catechol 2,3-dioxygenase-like lactoylglutathione lyase family enzyme